jgi:spore maturation protein SpmA
VITCLVTNWGVTVALGLLLTLSEWLAKTKRFEENGLLDLISHFLKTVLKHKGDKK